MFSCMFFGYFNSLFKMNKIEIFYSLFKTTPKQSINPSIHQSINVIHAFIRSAIATE